MSVIDSALSAILRGANPEASPEEIQSQVEGLKQTGGEAVNQALSFIPGLNSVKDIATNAPALAQNPIVESMTKGVTGSPLSDNIPNPGNPISDIAQGAVAGMVDTQSPKMPDTLDVPELPDVAKNFQFKNGMEDTKLPEPIDSTAPSTPPAAATNTSKAPKEDKLDLASVMKPVDSNDADARQKALDEAMKRRKSAAIPGAIAGIGDAIASGASAFGVNAPKDTQEKILNRAKSDFDESKTLFDEKLKNDPNSDVSQAYRQMVLQIAPEIGKQPAFQSMSAQAIGDKLPLIDTMMKAQASKDNRALMNKQIDANKNISLGLKEDQRQDKLEREGRDMINKVVSSRSGGLGLEDQKVNQAIHLQTMLNDAYDPKTGTYSIPPSMHTELAIGLQRLLSPSGATSQHLVDELRQKTAKEGLSGALIYMGFDPKEVGGTTQSVSKFFANAVKRQGLTSEKNRDTYVNQFKARLPTGLSEDRKKYLLDQEVGNKYSDYVKDKSAKPKLEKDSLGLF